MPDEHEIEQRVWNHLRGLAHRTDEAQRFVHRWKFWNPSDQGEDNLGFMLARDLGENQPGTHEIQVLRRVFREASSLGYVVPGHPTQADPNHNSRIMEFTFSLKGLRYLCGGVPLWDSTLMTQFLQQREADGKLLANQAALLLEAQRCIASRCNRAAVVMLGLANEGACSNLLQELAACTSAQPSPLAQEWGDLRSPNTRFARRWECDVRILEEIRRVLKPPGAQPQWWKDVWAYMPGSVLGLVSAVRNARNDAAHDPARVFSPEEVNVWFSGGPDLIASVIQLQAFFQNPPGGVNIPAV